MWDKPRTKAEFFRRATTVPWVFAGIGAVVAVGVIVYFLFVQPPPEPRGRNTETDMRAIYAGLAAVFAVGGLGWAFKSTARWRVLAARGQLAEIEDVRVSSIGRSGQRPVRLTYRVAGQSYTLARDMPKDDAHQLADDPRRQRILYDPQRPARADLVSTEILDLPDA